VLERITAKVQPATSRGCCRNLFKKENGFGGEIFAL